jgi:hypothetical protein
MGKERFHDIFNKVNKLPTNEVEMINEAGVIGQAASDAKIQQQNDELLDHVHDEILWDFRKSPKLFREGIPLTIPVIIGSEKVQLVISNETPIDFTEGREEQLEYSLYYDLIFNQKPFIITIPIFVIINKTPTADKLVIYVDVTFDPNDMSVDYKRK